MPKNLFGQHVTDAGQILGCEACPLDRAPGIVKIKGLSRIMGRRAMMWAMCPGAEENKQRLELVGRAGELLWKGTRYVGLDRSDFDIQNVVRCRPMDEQGCNRDPDPRELQCCSVYNESALERNAGRAVVHVVLGEVAGAQLLGKAFRKDRPVFWYAPWDVYVVLNWHPSYIVRNGGERAGWDYYVWRDRFRAVRAVMDNPGRWGYVRARGYRVVRTLAEFDAMERELRAASGKKQRVSLDIEDGTVAGKRAALLAGFGTGDYANPKDWRSWRGRCWSVVLDHPEVRYEPTHLREMKARVKRLVEDASIRKALQNGSYDSDACRDLLGAQLRGYDFDTMYGAYLRYSFLRSCSLENLTYLFFPEFCDYKDSVEEWEGKNFADAPLDRLLLRNAGDCDVTKHLEAVFAPHVGYELMQVYIHAGATLDHMERRGPLLDWDQWRRAEKIIPKLIAKLDRVLQHVSGESEFDCDSPKQVAWLIYDVLKLPETEAGRSTRREVLEELEARTGNSTLQVINKRRALGKIKSTYMEGYATSARLHDGELRTIWWLTGAVTGRLRSGRGEKAEAQGIVNLQNLHGNPLLQNMLVSDLRWREALDGE